jgi:tetratricopeptide (TPR) repeat protein
VLRGDDAGLAELDEAIALAESDEAAWFAANVRDSKGRCLIDLGRLEEGIGVVLGAADGLAAEGDAMTAASGEAYAARALVAAERGEEAVAILRGALDRIEPGTPPHTGIALELAELLDALGRPAEAAELRDGAA